MKKRLFIVSNRLPVNVTNTDKDIQINRSTGGLVTAISSYLQDEKIKNTNEYDETYWVGVPGCTISTWTKAMNKLDDKEYTYLPVYMGKKLYDTYYSGLSNSALWPLFHYFPSYAEYKIGFYESYIQANASFCEVLMKHAKPGDVIWIHDYHLLPLAGMLRKEMPEVTIGFFLHIPFPSFEIFRLLPKKWQEHFISGMLGADLIGFHTIDYVAHFLKSVQMILGLEDDTHVLRYDNRLIKVDVFPVSIDFKKYNDAWEKPEVAAIRENFSQQFSDKKVIFSADRLDYTKGVYQRLKAYEYFLEQFPEYHEKVVFVLVVVPSRDSISKYAERKKLIDEYIGDINSRIGNINWQPVIYQYQNLDFDELVAMYTACDLALITPLRDGMNLVAKEFIASRKDKQGVLVLSEMAGAAQELTEALMINPNDTEDIALKIKRGLEMTTAEQQKKMEAMQQRIATYDVKTWANDFMTELKSIKNKQKEFEVKFFDNEARMMMVGEYERSDKRLFLLDYDGTLVPFSAIPSEAKPSQHLQDLLHKLALDDRNSVYIISGRDSDTLDSWLGHLPINIIAEHGAKFKTSDGNWETIAHANEQWKDHVKLCMNKYVARCANTFVEIKDYSIAWHYRNANPEQAKIRASEIFAELSDFVRREGLQVLHGNKVIEVRNRGIDKGSAIKRVLANTDHDFILAFGDDTTDEDMFRILMDVDDAYTIKVGSAASYARYNLHTPYMVLSMLEMISNLNYRAKDVAVTG